MGGGEARAVGKGPAWSGWAWPSAFGLASALAAYASLHLTRFGGGVSSIWVANGMLVGALLVMRRQAWWRWMAFAFFGQMAARALIDDTLALSLGLALANMLECWLVAAWVRRGASDLSLAPSLGPVARDAITATLLACAVSATLATTLRGLDGSTAPMLTWTLWFLAHVLGLVIVATLVTSAGQPGVRRRLRGGESFDFLVGMFLMLAVTAATFLQTTYPLLFLPYLPLAFLAHRHGLLGMLMGVLVLAATSGLAAATDSGPFVLMQSTPLSRTLLWQGYIAAGCLLAFGTTVAVTQRAQLMRKLARSESRFIALTEYLPAMVARFDREGRYTYANARSRDMMPGVDLIGQSLRELRGDKVYGNIQRYVEGALRGEPQTYETKVTLNGREVELHAQFVPDYAADGSVQGFYSLAFDITEAKRNERELERLARFDQLTGLANRRHFDESLEDAVARVRRTGAGLMLISLDLDRFKQINDNFGHSVGDEVLRGFAARLCESVYEVDLVARQGGDEFHVLVEYTPRPEVAELIAGRILASMQAPMRISGHELQVATSIGIAIQIPPQSGHSLIELADAALYEAKSRGRNTWVLRHA